MISDLLLTAANQDDDDSYNGYAVQLYGGNMHHIYLLYKNMSPGSQQIESKELHYCLL